MSAVKELHGAEWGALKDNLTTIAGPWYFWKGIRTSNTDRNFVGEFDK